MTPNPGEWHNRQTHPNPRKGQLPLRNRDLQGTKKRIRNVHKEVRILGSPGAAPSECTKGQATLLSCLPGPFMPLCCCTCCSFSMKCSSLYISLCVWQTLLHPSYSLEIELQSHILGGLLPTQSLPPFFLLSSRAIMPLFLAC